MLDIASQQPEPFRLNTDKPISLAVLAMGGQGGGVLSDWIVALAESCGWCAQSTSVPGVAQRTGATIYYIEMLPAKDGLAPVLSLMPSPGDVDIVLAAEWMEAGRSMLRGLVTPEKTVLIASTHRSFAVVEKTQPGDGIGDPVAVTDAAGVAAKRTLSFDMEALAAKHGSVISATMFGALAGADVLPFPREAFEKVIAAGGKGIAPSLNAFAAGLDRAQAKTAPELLSRTRPKRFEPLPDSAGHPALDALVARIRKEFPPGVHPMLFAGVKRLVDFQDPAYAEEYLDRLVGILALDEEAGGAARNYALTDKAAKHVAVAMAYDDVIVVADLKTRAKRFQRVRDEVLAEPDQLVYTTEYMHPRAEEIIGLLPAGVGGWIERRPRIVAGIDRLFNKGRRVQTGTVRWFLALYFVSALRRFRRGTLRHRHERAHLDAWLDLARRQVGHYDLAVQIVAARRLVKGYSDTHARGLSKYDRVISAVPKLSARDDGADWLRRLVQAALLDENGVALDGALKTVETL
ncbi:indolepyruvate oxidoreductase subunit beta family protein [Methylocapsa sp. S129]|uniref:indolepyruvate oxidoreductase subunit beta family protein n=1 Tax=Methylocapsa sp. S129 TaxID=1641869 RepID=UPI00131BB35D|nr:indolepyruvate oxidoreductase subunit beta family protein [Methylocapsa sp. S129]